MSNLDDRKITWTDEDGVEHDLTNKTFTIEFIKDPLVEELTPEEAANFLSINAADFD